MIEMIDKGKILYLWTKKKRSARELMTNSIQLNPKLWLTEQEVKLVMDHIQKARGKIALSQSLPY